MALTMYMKVTGKNQGEIKGTRLKFHVMFIPDCQPASASTTRLQ